MRRREIRFPTVVWAATGLILSASQPAARAADPPPAAPATPAAQAAPAAPVAPAAAPTPEPPPALPPEKPAPAAQPEKAAPAAPSDKPADASATAKASDGTNASAQASTGETAPATDEEGGSSNDEAWARPYFVKGDLTAFAVRPGTRRNFIGVGGGISALPQNANSAINSYFLTVEPQLDIRSTAYNWKLGLGAPLQFELVDLRGAFEVCVGEARKARTMAGTDPNAKFTVAGAAAQCVSMQKDRALQNMGRLRRADWDQAGDFAKIVRYLIIGGQEQPFYLSLGRLYDQSLGHGTVVRQYNPNIDYNTARLGAVADFNKSAIGIQAVTNDLVRPDMVGLMAFLRPFRPFSESVFWRSLSIGGSWVHGSNMPRTLLYEPGLFDPACDDTDPVCQQKPHPFDQPIPQVGEALNLVGGRFAQMEIFGGDIEAKVLRTQEADLKLYVDYQKMSEHGAGITLGSLWRLSYGQPAWRALRARAEVTTFDADYLPNFYDTFHDIFQYQYLPISYKGSNGLTYYPTKMQFLDASRGGRRRVGGYFELTHSFLNYLTVGMSIRAWTPVGQPKTTGFVAPSFPDYDKNCTNNGRGELQCASKVTLDKEHGFTSMKFHAEFPFRRFLQAFASYELFSTTAEKGLGIFKFDGDNEVFFSGARLMLLPILFIQAEARRYFFLQRLSNVDLKTLSLTQDQTFHSDWTFAVNAFVGYEF